MSILDKDTLEQVKELFTALHSDIEFKIYAKTDSEETNEISIFLEELTSVSPKLSVSKAIADVIAPKFEIISNGVSTGVSFVGIPNGHEFTTLLLAILNVDRQGSNLPDETLSSQIKSLNGPIKLQTFVSLTCTNCRDVAQALNIIAILNPSVENEVIDGAIVPDLVKSLNIQSVPTVYANNQLLSIGRQTLGELLNKLISKFGRAEQQSVTKVSRQYDIVIIGGGPAGATAAIYSARKGRKTAIVAKEIGGQVKDTVAIDNLTSVPEISGQLLADNIRKHLSNYNIDIFENRTVDSLKNDNEIKTANCGNESFSAPEVIIATGASWRRLNVPGEKEHIGRGVAFCPHCDGPFYAGKNVAVVGGGNSGIEAALDLAGICRHVDIFEYLDSLKADTILQEKAKATKNISIHLLSQVEEIIGNSSKITGVKVKDLRSDKPCIFNVDGIFIQIGLSPNSAPFSNIVETTDLGEIKIDTQCRTSVNGIYSAGDVTNIPYKQILIAMGEGAKAALTAFDDSLHK